MIPDVVPAELCARARAHMDAVLAPPAEGGGTAARSHPIPGGIMAELCTTPTLLSVAEALYRAPAAELRLTEQVLIRTDPEPPDPAAPDEPTARGWHMGTCSSTSPAGFQQVKLKLCADFAFTPERFEPGGNRPRQTYFQMFSVYSDVKPGAGCTMVVPQSVSAGSALSVCSRRSDEKETVHDVAPQDAGRGRGDRRQPRRALGAARQDRR